MKENPAHPEDVREQDTTMTDSDYAAISGICKRFRDLSPADVEATRDFYNDIIVRMHEHITLRAITAVCVLDQDVDGIDCLKIRMPAGIEDHFLDIFLFYPETWHPRLNLMDVSDMLEGQRIELEDALNSKTQAKALDYRRLLRQTAKTILTACDELEYRRFWRAMPSDLPLQGIYILFKAKGADRGKQT
jgi:hypothetical protein